MIERIADTKRYKTQLLTTNKFGKSHEYYYPKNIIEQYIDRFNATGNYVAGEIQSPYHSKNIENFDINLKLVSHHFHNFYMIEDDLYGEFVIADTHYGQKLQKVVDIDPSLVKFEVRQFGTFYYAHDRKDDPKFKEQFPELISDNSKYTSIIESLHIVTFDAAIQQIG